jgi:hypothetical protein
MPLIVGRAAVIGSFKAWGSLIGKVHHKLAPAYVTDDGWVICFHAASMAFHNANKSKIITKQVPACINRIHINDDGKIDQFRSYWDMKEVVGAMMSSTENPDVQVPPRLDDATKEKSKQLFRKCSEGWANGERLSSSHLRIGTI